MSPAIAIGGTPTIKLPFAESSATELWKNFRGLITTAPTESIDKTIEQLVSNQSFIDYVEETNKIILKDPSKYEDISQKYR